MSEEDRSVIIQGLDLFDVVNFLDTKSRRFQAMALSNLEEVLDKDSEEFKYVRKIILDTMNNYTRSSIRAIFGDIESLNS